MRAVERAAGGGVAGTIILEDAAVAFLDLDCGMIRQQPLHPAIQRDLSGREGIVVALGAIGQCGLQAVHGFGALRRHVDTGRLSPASLHAELGQVVTGRRPGRERADERILLWHRGLAILDIAVGLAILRRAEQEGVGTMLRYR